MKIFTEKDIWLDNGYVHVNGIGTIGLWWEKFDKKVCIDWSIGESFIANTEQEVKEGVLKLINPKP